jgi:hypothetical protein
MNDPFNVREDGDFVIFDLPSGQAMAQVRLYYEDALRLEHWLREVATPIFRRKVPHATEGPTGQPTDVKEANEHGI